MTLRTHWTLDPAITFLNHGSFGATPRAVLELQHQYRAQMEAEPVRFFTRELESLHDQARASLARFLGARPENLVAVSNATEGANSVLRSLQLAEGDELLTTNHAYNACRNALEYVAARAGARVVVADVPFPIGSSDQVIEAVLERVTSRTALLLIDHVTSPTALIFPVEAIVKEFSRRGIDVLVDGAHAPGMLPLDLEKLGAAYYTGNCHKWISAPKGGGFLYVSEERQKRVRPTSISHGANSVRTDRSRYQLEFGWTGTEDPTAFLCVPAAIDFFETLLPGGWKEVRAENHRLGLAARDLICQALEIDKPAPDDMIGSMAAFPLPDGNRTTRPALFGDPLQDALFERHGIEVPLFTWPLPPRRLLRISAQVYNEISEYERLGGAVRELLAEERDSR